MFLLDEFSHKNVAYFPSRISMKLIDKDEVQTLIKKGFVTSIKKEYMSLIYSKELNIEIHYNPISIAMIKNELAIVGNISKNINSYEEYIKKPIIEWILIKVY